MKVLKFWRELVPTSNELRRKALSLIRLSAAFDSTRSPQPFASNVLP